MRQRGIVFAALLLATMMRAASPAITTVTPLAVAATGTTTLVLQGTHLEQPAALWTDFESAGGRTDDDLADKRVAFRITPGSDTPVGIYLLRLFATNGVSNLRALMVDDLPTLPQSTTNHSLPNAQSVEIPTAVDGQSLERNLDYFRFAAKRDQPVAIEIVAARLGSRMDSVVRVLDAEGRELAYCDDDGGIRFDSRLVFVAPRSADYFIEVRDVNYGGGAEFFYRLRIGDFPLIDALVPRVVPSIRNTRVTLVGRNLPAESGFVSAETNAPVARLAAKKRHSGFATVITSQLPIIGSESAGAEFLPTPCVVHGRFGNERQRDVYRFRAKAHQWIVFQSRTRRLGSACDALLKLENAGGKRLAVSPVTSSEEAAITYRFTEAGEYRLLVEEAAGASGPALTYAIEIREPERFSLGLESDKVEISPDGMGALNVVCQRGEYKDDVWLDVEGFDGLSVTNHVIAAGKTNVTLSLRLTEMLNFGAARHIRVFGRTKEGTGRVEASTEVALKRAFPLLLYPPAEADGSIAVGSVAGTAE